MKIKRKITAFFIALILLSVVAGFCDSLIDSVKAGGVDLAHNSMNYQKNDISVINEKGTPFDNSLKPCCVDKHTGIPSIQSTNFNAGIKLMPSDVSVSSPSLTLFFENKLNISDTSPPRPDKISSVLRLE